MNEAFFNNPSLSTFAGSDPTVPIFAVIVGMMAVAAIGGMLLGVRSGSVDLSPGWVDRTWDDLNHGPDGKPRS